jgi:hypothetical protein
MQQLNHWHRRAIALVPTRQRQTPHSVNEDSPSLTLPAVSVQPWLATTLLGDGDSETGLSKSIPRMMRADRHKDKGLGKTICCGITPAFRLAPARLRDVATGGVATKSAAKPREDAACCGSLRDPTSVRGANHDHHMSNVPTLSLPLWGRFAKDSPSPRVPLRSTRGYSPRPLRGRSAPSPNTTLATSFRGTAGRWPIQNPPTGR